MQLIWEVTDELVYLIYQTKSSRFLAHQGDMLMVKLVVYQRLCRPLYMKWFVCES